MEWWVYIIVYASKAESTTALTGLVDVQALAKVLFHSVTPLSIKHCRDCGTSIGSLVCDVVYYLLVTARHALAITRTILYLRWQGNSPTSPAMITYLTVSQRAIPLVTMEKSLQHQSYVKAVCPPLYLLFSPM